HDPGVGADVGGIEIAQKKDLHPIQAGLRKLTSARKKRQAARFVDFDSRESYIRAASRQGRIRLADRLRIMVVFGTRPEAVKMAPVVSQLRKRPDRAEAVLCATAQHREMLDQVIRVFGMQPDLDLDLMRPGQGLPDLTAESMLRLEDALGRVQPDVVLVQG